MAKPAPVLTRRFPRLDARDLEGTPRVLPEAFDGERNVVVLAFRARHQVLVDSWLGWLEARAAGDPGLRYFEIPTSSSVWLPVNRSIDRGMAGAVQEAQARRRTLTVYGDRRRMTDAVGIDDISTITVAVVDRDGWIRWTAPGPYDEAVAAALARVLDEMATETRPTPRQPKAEQFGFAFDRRTRPVLAAIGVVPRTATVFVGDGRLEARFGPWTCSTALDNVAEVEVVDPAPWWDGSGVRVSVPGCGLRFASSGGPAVRVVFREPVRGLLPAPAPRHPTLTVTVDDPDALVGAIEAATRPG